MTVKDFFSNWIIKNLVGALVLVIALMIFVRIFLGIVTHHGDQSAVPDFTGMTVTEAASAARKAGMRIEVVDSIYVKRIHRGCVVRQEPKAGSTVKEGRRIQLTINAVVPKNIPMPNLVGYSLRSASAALSSQGLELGTLVYVDDIATNNVLKQIYRNYEIKPGVMVPSESRIDLVLGLSEAERETTVPDLTGMKYRRAIEVIHDNSLNVGNVVYARGIKTYADSVNAVVRRQNPEPLTASIPRGRSVTIYLGLE